MSAEKVKNLNPIFAQESGYRQIGVCELFWSLGSIDRQGPKTQKMKNCHSDSQTPQETKIG